MRKIFLIVALACTTFLMADTKRHYCTPEQIEIRNNTIMVHANQGVFELETLHVDQGGIYYQEKHLRCPECRRYRGINPKNTCETPNCPAAK